MEGSESPHGMWPRTQGGTMCLTTVQWDMTWYTPLFRSSAVTAMDLIWSFNIWLINIDLGLRAGAVNSNYLNMSDVIRPKWQVETRIAVFDGWRIYRCVKTDIPFYGSARDIVNRRIKWFESVALMKKSKLGSE